jgi:hypothetical protein
MTHQRRVPLKTIADTKLLADFLGLRRPQTAAPRHVDLFSRWAFQRDDPDARVVSRRLEKVWAHWKPDEREILLLTAESVARAEEAKLAWNPKLSRRQYLRLSRTSSDAARLANRISVLFPPPWEGSRGPIGDLVRGLRDYAERVLRATIASDNDIAFWTAHYSIRELRRRTRRASGKVSWELLADLVWLASGKEIQRPNEITIRRYLSRRRGSPTTKSPAAPHWRRNWHLFSKMKLGPRQSDSLDTVFETVLQDRR